MKIALAGAGFAALGAATPASATVVLTAVNGSNLPVFIKASTTNTQDNNVQVFGCTQNNGQCANVTFTANTPVGITDGAGFAAISDVAGGALFTAITSDPVPTFNAYQFSIQLLDAGFFLAQYSLNDGATWVNALSGPLANPISQGQMQLRDYQLTALNGEVLTAIRLSTCATALLSSCNTAGGTAGTGVGIFLFKQNSINLSTVAPPPVPEPATWGMMLLGFAGIGMAMRRSRRRDGALMQVA
jgi:hypothetical protein